MEYLNKKSATALWIIKLIEGLGYLAGIVLTVIVINNYTRDMGIQISSISDLLNSLSQALGESGVQSANLSALNLLLSAEAIASMLLVFIILIYFIVWPILIILDAIGSTTLRFGKKGAGLISVIHLIHMIMSLLFLAITIVFFIQSVIMMIRAAAQERAGMILTLVVLALIMVGEILMFCYQKDIVRAMKTVKANIAGDEDFTMKKTHLSGISILFGILVSLALLLLCIALIPSGLERQYTAMVLIVVLFFALKFFFLAAGNRNLKKYNTR